MPSINEIINGIYQEWLDAKHPSQAFIFLLRNFQKWPGQRDQGLFLEAYYALMRGIDNYADGDVNLDEETTVVSFLEQRIDFIERVRVQPNLEPKHSYDRLFKYCVDLADKLDQTIYDESLDIMRSMLFDAKRRRGMNEELLIFSETEINKYFFALDIEGTIKANLKAFGEDPNKSTYLEQLGTATRIWFNGRDLAEDLVTGYVNVSKEKMEQFGVPKEDLLESRRLSYDYLQRLQADPRKKEEEIRQYYLSLPEPVKRWLFSEAKEGLKRLDQHKEEFKQGNFNLLSRLYCPLVYGIHAKKYFNFITTILNPQQRSQA